MKKNITVTSYKQIILKEIAFISTEDSLKKELETLPVYRITKEDHNLIVIDSFLIIDYLNQQYPHLEFQLLGPTETIIRFEQNQKSPSLLIVALIWLLLFIGAGMTIMNFHYDVSMQEVQQKLHFLITGEKNDFPLLIQIPYSFGLGIGMLLFFNHWFKKRFNEEPSPLEVELFKYQQEINQHIAFYENQLNDDS